jgi:hypothetical protein
MSPKEVRHALVYILHNRRKHAPGIRGLDDRSSAVWFTGWRTRITTPAGRAPVASPYTWLARVGWRRHGLIGLHERPRSAPTSARSIIKGKPWLSRVRPGSVA